MALFQTPPDPDAPPRATARETVFLINPHAGGMRLAQKHALVARVAEGLASETAVSTSEGHAAEIAKDAMRAGKVVVACGGDGLQNIVAEQAVATGGLMTAMPLGRGNDFAASLQLRTAQDTRRALTLGKVQHAPYVALAFAGHARVCLTCAGVGLLSEASARALRLPILRGRLLYAVAALISLAKLDPKVFSVTLDNERVSRDLLILVGAASPYTGGGIPIAPQAQAGAGQLNVLYAPGMGKIGATRLFLRALSGRHLEHPAVHSGFFDNCRLSSAAVGTSASMVFGDGEFLGHLPVTMTLGDKPLRVLVPGAPV